MVAEADDALMEKFFEAGTLTQEELVGGLKRAVRAGRVFPLFCTSATANIGMQPLLDAIVAYVPSPAERPFAATAKAATRSIAAADDRAGRGVRVEDGGRSVRRPHHDVPRHLGHRSRRTRPSTT